MSILISLLVLALVVFIAFWIVDAIPLPAPINVIAKTIVAILALIKLFNIAGWM